MGYVVNPRVIGLVMSEIKVPTKTMTFILVGLPPAPSDCSDVDATVWSVVQSYLKNSIPSPQTGSTLLNGMSGVSDSQLSPIEWTSTSIWKSEAVAFRVKLRFHELRKTQHQLPSREANFLYFLFNPGDLDPEAPDKMTTVPEWRMDVDPMVFDKLYSPNKPAILP
eukprot:CAMPEP_0184685936 /NCGR_PEP_ID=MMETSP0312-20130426/20734_1 /TAXON_ID=31354 /ORGANISM="Compsopogon coeruleus, Strain SAG 36.94" /LENGTH=165 /DNA_ID=CAMNT_0027140535 /DNA_START=288 /DNA_END=783 /DNA_ORIENTATION=-